MEKSQRNLVRRVEPLALDWRHFRWDGASFDSAQRPRTHVVEGTIRLPQYLILATLQGGARTLYRLHAQDGILDAAYCDAMTFAAAHHLQRRYLGLQDPRRASVPGLPRWQMRRIEEYVEEQLAGAIRIGDLARLTGYSQGYFHRAFRQACGVTPLEFVNHRRVQRALRIREAEPDIGVAELAERVGYTSPNHFARLFRRIAGGSPSSTVGRRHR